MAANGDNRDGVLVEIGVGPAAIRRRFEALLSEQWSEIPDFSRPIPPVLGDGTEVDLSKLSLVLISNGGFDFVCESKLWDSVAEESGLGSSAGSAVKVVYCRYLSEFVDDDDMFGMFGKRLTDLERLLVDYVSDEFHPDMKIAGIEFRWKSVDDDDDDDDDDDYAGLLLYADGDSGSRKRKRESLSGMLSWLAKLAKNPLDPAVGSLPKKSKWKSFSDREVWKLGLLLRKALFFRMRFGSRTARMKWQNKRMHPFMYDDHTMESYNLREKLLLNRRPGRAYDDEKRQKYEAGIYECSESKIRLGSSYQAEVPEWTGITSESDPQLMGYRTWPPQENQQ